MKTAIIRCLDSEETVTYEDSFIFKAYTNDIRELTTANNGNWSPKGNELEIILPKLEDFDSFMFGVSQLRNQNHYISIMVKDVKKYILPFSCKDQHCLEEMREKAKNLGGSFRGNDFRFSKDSVAAKFFTWCKNSLI